MTLKEQLLILFPSFSPPDVQKLEAAMQMEEEQEELEVLLESRVDDL